MCVRFLNDIVWLLQLDLNSVSLIPKWTFVENSLSTKLYRQYCRSVLTIFNICRLMDDCFYSYNCIFYHLILCKHLLFLCYHYWLYSLCNLTNFDIIAIEDLWYLRSEDRVVWVRYLLVNLNVYDSPFHLAKAESLWP